MQEELSHVGSSCGWDGQTACDSIRILFRFTKSAGRLRHRQHRQADKQRRVMTGMREGESCYFLKKNQKNPKNYFFFLEREEGREKKNSTCRCACCWSPHLSPVLGENELQLIKTVCAVATAKRVNTICAGETQSLWSLSLWLCSRAFSFLSILIS